MTDEDKQLDEDKQPSFPEQRYVDPNSGAAPQPGGFAHTHIAEDADDPNEPNDNVTMPEDANERSEGSGEDEGEGEGQDVEELPDELIRSQAYDTELQNQAAPLGSQPGVEDRTDDGPLPMAADPGTEVEEKDGDEAAPKKRAAKKAAQKS